MLSPATSCRGKVHADQQVLSPLVPDKSNPTGPLPAGYSRTGPRRPCVTGDPQQSPTPRLTGRSHRAERTIAELPLVVALHESLPATLTRRRASGGQRRARHRVELALRNPWNGSGPTVHFVPSQASVSVSWSPLKDRPTAVQDVVDGQETPRSWFW